MTSPVSLCQLIKDNHLYAEKLHATEKKIDKEWAGFEPLDEQLGTSPGMLGERPTAIASVGEHEVQHESTDCWEFFYRPAAASCSCPGTQLVKDPTELVKTTHHKIRTGEKKKATAKKHAADSFKSPVSGRMLCFQIFLLSIKGSMNGILNGSTGNRPRGPRGQGAL